MFFLCLSRMSVCLNSRFSLINIDSDYYFTLFFCIQEADERDADLKMLHVVTSVCLSSWLAAVGWASRGHVGQIASRCFLKAAKCRKCLPWLKVNCELVTIFTNTVDIGSCVTQTSSSGCINPLITWWKCHKNQTFYCQHGGERMFFHWPLGVQLRLTWDSASFIPRDDSFRDMNRRTGLTRQAVTVT